MNAAQAYQAQLRHAHFVYNGTTADVTPEGAHWQPGGVASSVAAAMAHVVFDEDLLMGILYGQPPLAMTTFAGKTGISDPQPIVTPEWVKSVRLDLPIFRKYTEAVFAATDQSMARLTDAELDREVDLSMMGMGKQSLAWCFDVIIIGHLHNLAGEISAVKGMQGLKGYPF